MTLTAVLLLLAAAPAGPPSLADVPPFDQQHDDFYHAVADAPVSVRWGVDREAVPLDGELLLTLAVRGAANPGELVRPDLRRRPDFAGTFQVEDAPGPAPTPGEVRYAYRLRPKRVGEVEVPVLRYRYYRPRFPDGRRMQTTRTDPLRVTVTPPAPVRPAAAVPLSAPEAFFALPSATDAGAVGRWAWLIPLALVPGLVAGWVILWRLWFPDAARRRRSRAARVALIRLTRADPAPDQGGAVADIVLDYLAARAGLPAAARTPAEVAAALLAAGWPADRAAEAETLLRACDAARFAPPADTGATLARRAAALVTAWEDAAP